MKRNWDTIREILTRLEEVTPEEHSLRLLSFPSEHAVEMSYHMELLMEAGLVNGQMSKTIGPGPHDFLAIRLTWQGHEFLDAIRSDTVWQKTKKSFIGSGLSMTLDLVKSVAADIAASLLKSPMTG
jgi:hypothetical protein